MWRHVSLGFSASLSRPQDQERGHQRNEEEKRKQIMLSRHEENCQNDHDRWIKNAGTKETKKKKERK